MTKEIPEHLTWNITDKRLKKLTEKVWKRLPEYDQTLLQALLVDISDDQTMDENSLGECSGNEFPFLLPGENLGNIANTVTYTISLTNAKEVKSDPGCMFIIAHEFAHVVLRHLQIGSILNSRYGAAIYSEQQIREIQDQQDDTASLLCWTWGFSKEFEELITEFPNTSIPQWFTCAS